MSLELSCVLSRDVYVISVVPVVVVLPVAVVVVLLFSVVVPVPDDVDLSVDDCGSTEDFSVGSGAAAALCCGTGGLNVVAAAASGCGRRSSRPDLERVIGIFER